jgi:hypothetical protein
MRPYPPGGDSNKGKNPAITLRDIARLAVPSGDPLESARIRNWFTKQPDKMVLSKSRLEVKVQSMNALYWVLTVTISILLAGCAVSNRRANLPLRDIAKGGFSGIQEERRTIIQDEAAWRKFWAEHARGEIPESQPPAVDFENEMVVAATMGQRPTGGYEIEIVEVREEAGELVVRVMQQTPPEDAMLIQALTAPFHFVAVPKNPLPGRFVMAEPEERNP